jgi:hypothetical protein
LLVTGGDACLEDRPRPAPPVITITIDQATVRSPDTVTGTITVRDPDGIDSVWVRVDTVRRGDDAFLETVFSSPYRFPVRSGLVAFDLVPIRGEARDVVGFVGLKDTFVRVRGP